MFEALARHVSVIAREPKKIGLVILRGAGANFSAGYDTHEVLEQVKAHAKPHFHSEVIKEIANLPQPVISAQGHCSTGALELASELAAVSADILSNSWYANQVNKRALIEVDGLSLHDAHALEMFKNEGLAPDAGQRIAKFTEK